MSCSSKYPSRPARVKYCVRDALALKTQLLVKGDPAGMIRGNAQFHPHDPLGSQLPEQIPHEAGPHAPALLLRRHREATQVKRMTEAMRAAPDLLFQPRRSVTGHCPGLEGGNPTPN